MNGSEVGGVRNMIRKLVLLAVFVVFSTEFAHAVGLGELKADSALNQAFNAEITLTNFDGLGPDEILPNLASQEDFDRVGVDRAAILLDLRFKVIANADGDLIIKITSIKPIIEPFLNFVVELLWPSGRLLREYTILMDPPVFGRDGFESIAAASASQPVRSMPPSGRVEIPRDTERGQSQVSGSISHGSALDDEYGMTGSGDTLWSIARKVRPGNDVSIQQTMLAIKRINPNAFLNNNINLLKAGHVLRIPDRDQIEELDTSDAVATVREQNDAWQAYRSGETGRTQLDASRSGMDATARDDRTGEGELRVLSADSQLGERAGSGSRESSAQVAEAQAQLAVALEDLDTSKRANTELKSRLDDLTEQVETMTQLVQLKDDQLAELQAQLKQVQEIATGQVGAMDETPVSQPKASLFTNPLVLGGIVVLLLAGVVAVLLIRRQKNVAADEPGIDLAEISAGSATDDETAVMASQEAEDDLDSELDELTDDDQEAEEEELSQQTEDVLSEADIYIAYGRFPQAVSFLATAIQSEPDRADIQLKLLEVYVQTEDSTEFNLLFNKLQELGDEAAMDRARELQSKLPGAAEEAAAAMGATVISTDPIAAIEEPEDDDDLSFDLDDLDSETGDDDLEIGDLEFDDDDLDSDDDLDLDLDDDILDLDSDDLFEESSTGLEEESSTGLLEESSTGLLEESSTGLEEESSTGLLEESSTGLEEESSTTEDALESEPTEASGDELELDLDLAGDDLDIDLEDDSDLADTDAISLGEADSEEDLDLALGDDADFDLDLDDDADLDLLEPEEDADLDSTSVLAADDLGDTAIIDLEGDASAELDLDDEVADTQILGQKDLDSTSEEADFELDDISLDDSEKGVEAGSDPDDEDTLDLDADDALDLDGADDLDLDGDDLNLDGADDLDLDADDLDLDADDLNLGGAELDGDADALDLDGSDDLDLDADDDLKLDTDELDGDADALDLDGNGDLDLDADDDFDLDDISLEELGENAGSKLDLARAYIDMADTDGARSILEEVQQSGSDSEKEEAAALLAKINQG